MGGLGNCVKRWFYGEITRSTNADDFKKFLLKLRAEKTCRRRPWLILDNHRAHLAKSVQHTLNRHFRPLFLPPYSCEFSSVERVWNILKQRVLPTHTMFMFLRSADREMMIKAVELELENISQTTLQNVFHSNRNYIQKFLD